MARYLDSGTNADETVGAWLDKMLKEQIFEFCLQAAYAEATLFHHLIHSSREAGPLNVARVILGANQKSLSRTTVCAALDFVCTAHSGSLVIVSFANALYHPKTIYVKTQPHCEAYVGSANFTLAGMGKNAEAGLTLSSREGDDKLLAQIRSAFDFWLSEGHAGCFSVASSTDIELLVDNGVIENDSIDEGVEGGKTRWPKYGSPGQGVSRSPTWQPSSARGERLVSESRPESADMRWWKKMASSDAQQTGKKTNPTGKLRLTKAGHDIEHTSFFRDDFFVGVSWAQVIRDKKTIELATVDFRVRVAGVNQGIFSLLVDHAPHRIANQGNVPTVLAWGPALGSKLRGVDYTGWWVVLTRRSDGSFHLEITDVEPES